MTTTSYVSSQRSGVTIEQSDFRSNPEFRDLRYNITVRDNKISVSESEAKKILEILKSYFPEPVKEGGKA